MGMVVLISSLLSLSLSVYLLKDRKKRVAQRELLALYLIEIQEEIDNLSFDCYLQKSWLREHIVDEVLSIYNQDKKVLTLLKIEESPDIFMIIRELDSWLNEMNTIFIENELKQYRDYFNKIESKPLTQQQRVAVITNEQNNLILAGAGSGKTSVIVAKVGYVLEKKYAKKEEILILAFNKKAQHELQERIDSTLGIKVEVRTFHAFGKKIIQSSTKEECSDFNAMIVDATTLLKEGSYHSAYKYIFIDEFQDISSERNELILALKENNILINITAVGDDWQAINGFAGSDIGIIQNFEALYGDTATIKLDYTFRFNATIAEVSKKFILKNSKQIPKEIKSIAPETKHALYVHYYKDKNKMDEHIEFVLNFISKNIKEKKTLMILSRYGFYKPKSLTALQEKFSTLEIAFETVHGAKGLEADYVILTHMESGKFGFPSEQSAVDLDDYPYAEERRLFYVALTRAKEKVFFIGNSNHPSIFIEELLAEHELILF